MTNKESAAQDPLEQALETVDEAPVATPATATDVPGAAAAPDLQQALATAEQQAAEYYEQMLRGRAELENLRRRTERELANAHKYAIEKFALELLPVRDSLKLGLAAVGESNADVARLQEGTELTLKMLTAAMAKFGIAELNPAGERFNPELHQAIAVLPGDVEPNMVLTVHQHGYRLHDRLIRPAMVVVSGAKPAAAGSASGGAAPESEKS